MSSNSTSRYRMLVENSSDLVAEVTPEGRYLYVSPNFETLLGYPPEELIRSEIFAHIHPDDQELAMKQFALPETSMTLRYRHRNGSWRWLDVNGRDFITPAGEQRGVLIARDVTERQQAEEALRQSEQHTRAILDNALDAVVGTCERGLITEWNAQAERVFGWSRAEVVGRRMAEVLVPPAARSAHEQCFKRFRAGGEPRIMNQRLEMTALHRDGREIPVELSITPISTDTGVGFCSFIRDLTGMKEAQTSRARLEAQLFQSQKLEAIGRLAGGIAHDFNNILTVITTNNELASMEVGVAHPAADCHAEIHRACQRAADLVRQILTFSRPRKLERHILALSSAVNEAVKMLRPILPASIEITTSFHPTCPSVLADPGQMMQVLLNLATNAAHAMRQNAGRLELSTKPVAVDKTMASCHPDLRPGEYVQLSVSDTGQGMDEVTLERIFEPFFTTKPVGDGTGLGLAVVHGIVKSHSGAILVNSELGKGTTFHLYFPAVEGSAAPSESTTPGIPLGRGGRVLFVEDEPALAESGRRILKRIGYEPTVCRDTAEAMSIFEKAPTSFVCIICDLNMPGGNGVDFAEQTRRLRNGTPFILTTGSTGMLTLDVLKGRGVTALLEKPFSPQLLAQTLHRVLAEAKPNS